MKIGKVSFNVEAFKDYTKEQFCEEFKGKLDIDKEQVWDMICQANKTVEHESIDTISEPSEVIEHKRSSKSSKRG